MYPEPDIPQELDKLLLVHGASTSRWEQGPQGCAATRCKIVLLKSCIFLSLKWSCLQLFYSLQWGTVPVLYTEQNMCCSHAWHVLPSGTLVAGSRAGRQILSRQKKNKNQKQQTKHLPAIPAKGTLSPLQQTTSC